MMECFVLQRLVCPELTEYARLVQVVVDRRGRRQAMRADRSVPGGGVGDLDVPCLGWVPQRFLHLQSRLECDPFLVRRKSSFAGRVVANTHSLEKAIDG